MGKGSWKGYNLIPFFPMLCRFWNICLFVDEHIKDAKTTPGLGQGFNDDEKE